MNRFASLWKALAFTAVAGTVLATQGGAQQLTGAIVYATDVNGAPNTDGWNTLGGDTVNNIYIRQQAAFINGPGNGADARINVNLSVPGTYSFFMYGDGGSQNDHHALNLFFDGNDSTPRISVFAATDTTGTTTAFTANSNANSRNLGYFGSVPAANTASYSDLGRTITVTAFGWSAPSVTNQNFVSPFSIAPNEVNDYTGRFTLTVTGTATPEPGSFALLGAAVLTGAGFMRRKRK